MLSPIRVPAFAGMGGKVMETLFIAPVPVEMLLKRFSSLPVARFFFLRASVFRAILFGARRLRGGFPAFSDAREIDDVRHAGSNSLRSILRRRRAGHKRDLLTPPRRPLYGPPRNGDHRAGDRRRMRARLTFAARSAARLVLPPRLRTSLSRRLAERAFRRRMTEAFAERFTPTDPGPAPEADIVVKTNAKTELAFERSFGDPASGANTYFTTGYNGVRVFVTRLAENGCDLKAISTIFELGCGDGRMLRHMRSIRGARIIGSDTRPEAVAWCRERLPGAEFYVNGFEPPLEFLAGESVDLAYAFSVFTHIPLAAQRAWLEELRRILKPGAFALLTVMGDSLKDSLSEQRRRELAEKGELEITSDDEEAHLATKARGSLWDVYQSRENILEAFGAVFEVLEYLPDGLRPGRAPDAPGLGQDLVVLRKPR
jgi:SAM-dependent methyltransferase